MGRKIKELRELLGLDQIELARLAGVRQQTLGAIEVRDSKSSMYSVAIAGAMGVTLEQLQKLPVDVLYRHATGQLRQAASPVHVVREDRLELYSATPDRQRQLLRLFDELTPPQQDSVLQEIEALVNANRTVVQHYAKRTLRTAEDGRVEATFGSPPENKPRR